MEENLPHPPVFDGCIHNIKFSMATSKEIRTSSTNDCAVTHHSQLMNPFLGLPLESGKCESCGTTEIGQCEGHFGFIELPTPIYHPCHVSALRNLLSLVCLRCLRVKKDKVRHGLSKERLGDASCVYCRNLPPISVKEVKNSDGAIGLELKVSSKTRLKDGFWNFLEKYGSRYGDSFCRPLLPSEVLEILKRIPEDTKKRLSAKGHFPQFGYIVQCLPVPPNCLYVPDISDGKSTISNDMSIPMLRKVLNKIELIRRSRSGRPNFESQEIESNELQAAISQYMHLRGTKKAPIDNTRKLPLAIGASNSSAKQWLEKMRSLFISKGSGYSSRSVITGDAYKGTNEIGIPSEIAKKITFEERVTNWNLQRLQELVDNRQCLRYRDGSSMYSTEEGCKGYTSLKVGQVVNRRIMDGDIVFVNRPPTTHKHALQAFSVYVHDDHTVKINPLICAPFGADFDGDCIHIFYPQSLAAKAEVMELFSVEQQLCSSHSGKLNLQLVNDSLLALKLMYRTAFLKKPTAQQLGMFTSPTLPPPALIRAHGYGPYWTVLQILQNTLPALLDSSGERHLISKSEILKLDFNRDFLHLTFTDIATSVLLSKGPKEALNFVNSLQPLLMEILFIEGFSLNLEDFYIPVVVLNDIKAGLQEISGVLYQLRSSYNELVDLQVESHFKNMKSPIVDFVLRRSALGDLVDSKSDSAILKVIQQLGFIGLQLFIRGKLYSKSLVDDMFSHFVDKYSADGDDHPSEAFGLIKNSFFHGLNPYDELVHSISSREVIVRSSRGLAEPGTLFKNLMAILRDVAICYDGTVRNVCSNSIVQFEYEVDGGTKSLNLYPPGEPVGVLAATAISNPAYKAVLDSSQSTNSSWDLMKEVLLSKVSFNNDIKSRRVIVYLEDCHCEENFCKEKAACVVQSCLRKVTLKECAIDFSIFYQNETIAREGSEAVPGLVGHIHLDKTCLNVLNRSAMEILQKCQEAISDRRRKRGQISQLFKRVAVSASECCSCSCSYNEEMPQFPCLQFSYFDDNSSTDSESTENTIHIMANAICPILLDTIIKGDSRVHAANITWIDPGSTSWVLSSCKTLRGEVAIEVVIEKDVVKRSGDAWRIVLDSCLPVMHLIDTRRSIPCGIQQIQDLLGISCAFDLSVQRLSTAIRTVAKGVLKEHLLLVANSMTCTGNLIGFNTSGYRAFFRSLNVQVPFTEATLVTPMKCFERAAEKCHLDSLSSIVGSSLWGKNVAIGTGTRFQILLDSRQMENEQNIGKDVYDFLHLVRENTGEMETSACLGVDVDELLEDGNLSPEHDLDFVKPTFDDTDEVDGYIDRSSFPENVNHERSGWEKVAALSPESNGWESFAPSASKSDVWEKAKGTVLGNKTGGWEKDVLSTSKSDSWASGKESVRKSDVWEKDAFSTAKSDGLPKHSASDVNFDGWAKVAACASPSDGWENDATCASGSDGWEKPAPSTAKSDGWEKPALSTANSDGWQKVAPSTANSDGWEKAAPSTAKSNDQEMHDNADTWRNHAALASNLDGWQMHAVSVANSDGLQKPAASSPSFDGWQGWGEKGKGSDNHDGISAPKPCSWSSVSADNQQGWDTNTSWKNTSSNASQNGVTFSTPDSPANQNSIEGSVWRSQNLERQNDNRGQRQRNQPTRPQGWGSWNTGDNKSQKVHSDRGWNTGCMTTTGRRLDSFTSEEEKILTDLEPIMQSIRRILHQSSYSDGDRLSAEDQRYILDKVFQYHPDSKAKVSGEIDHVTVNKHKDFPDSRCFFVVSTDGTSADFSYIKCMSNFVMTNYENGETFNKKYFRQRRAEAPPPNENMFLPLLPLPQ